MEGNFPKGIYLLILRTTNMTCRSELKIQMLDAHRVSLPFMGELKLVTVKFSISTLPHPFSFHIASSYSVENPSYPLCIKQTLPT